ncbi:MAG: ribosome-associated translation inhibitor RaiA [Phycisphaerales bacterium]|nr:ribosome-associated translation inhibitor RaiA [Phycisphaerales bacterium]
MRIEVTGKHMSLTPAITQYAEQKAAKLPRFYDGVQEIKVILEQSRPEAFEAEVRADVQKHSDFVGRVTGQDIYECIDLAVDKVARQLTDFKERLKMENRGSNSRRGGE